MDNILHVISQTNPINLQCSVANTTQHQYITFASLVQSLEDGSPCPDNLCDDCRVEIINLLEEKITSIEALVSPDSQAEKAVKRCYKLIEQLRGNSNGM